MNNKDQKPDNWTTHHEIPDIDAPYKTTVIVPKRLLSCEDTNQDDALVGYDSNEGFPLRPTKILNRRTPERTIVPSIEYSGNEGFPLDSTKILERASLETENQNTPLIKYEGTNTTPEGPLEEYVNPEKKNSDPVVLEYLRQEMEAVRTQIVVRVSQDPRWEGLYDNSEEEPITDIQIEYLGAVGTGNSGPTRIQSHVLLRLGTKSPKPRIHSALTEGEIDIRKRYWCPEDLQSLLYSEPEDVTGPLLVGKEGVVALNYIARALEDDDFRERVREALPSLPRGLQEILRERPELGLVTKLLPIPKKKKKKKKQEITE